MPHTELDMHHPQLAKRSPVIGAGVFGWLGEEVLYIDNKSGCYAPDTDSLFYVVEAFKFYGVPLSKNLKIDYFFLNLKTSDLFVFKYYFPLVN